MRLSRRTFVLCGVLSLVCWGATTLSGQTKTLPTDHLTGTWKINLAKSKYSPANLAPKSGQSRITITTAGIKVSTDGVNAEGKKTHTEYTAKLDGKDYPWKGTVDGQPSTDQDAVSWKQIDEWTYEVTNKLKNKVTTVMKIAIEHDGKTRTNTTTGTNAQGQTVSNTTVYEKQ
jgi:hypothetical protein